MNLNDAVDDLHPAPPPCFTNRLEWLEYLKSAAACQNKKGEPAVILRIGNRGGQPIFNYQFDYCCDCTPKFANAMTAKGRCNPCFLEMLEGAKP